jgi:hypothetical protein
MKKYKLLKKIETPSLTIYSGTIKTSDEWKNIFDDLEDNDFKIFKDWFEEVKSTHNKRHPMCEDQLAQIDCRVKTCIHYKEGGDCLNVSPAITLYSDGTFKCWSYENKE